MYAIGNIIVGTHVPQMREEVDRLTAAIVAADPDRWRDGSESDVDLMASVERGEVDVFESEPWHKEYHGGVPFVIAWLGVRLDEFDETEHLAFSTLKFTPTDEQMRLARADYDALPESVRNLLPPFGVYIVWGSS